MARRIEWCSCCKKEHDISEIFYLSIPDAGYSSRFDYVDPENDKVSFILCSDCLRKISKWLKSWYPKIKLKEFWKFQIIEAANKKDLPRGFHKKLQYDDELYRMMMCFIPDKYLHKPVGKIKRLVYKIIYSPFWGRSEWK